MSRSLLGRLWILDGGTVSLSRWFDGLHGSYTLCRGCSESLYFFIHPAVGFLYALTLAVLDAHRMSSSPPVLGVLLHLHAPCTKESKYPSIGDTHVPFVWHRDLQHPPSGSSLFPCHLHRACSTVLLVGGALTSETGTT